MTSLALVILALAAHGASPTSAGFRVPGGLSGSPKLVCAVDLPHRAGLYCASPLIKPHTYDQLGVLKMSSAGTVTIVRGGSDILLAIERARPILKVGRSWSANGYRCARTTTAVRCLRRSHGFVIAKRLGIF